MENYEVINHICESSYANIYRAINKKNDDIVALKVMPLDKTGVSVDAIREVLILKLCKNNYIINLMDTFIYAENIILVLPYAEYNLKEYNLNYNFDIDTIFKQITLAVNYCHQNYLIHRDVKPENILIIDNEVKLADFGLAKYDFFNEPKSFDVVSLWYRAPELLLNLPYNYKVDVWSLGCIYYELIAKEVLFKGQNNYDQLNLIYNKPYFDNPLIDKMLKLSAARINTTQILQLIK